MEENSIASKIGSYLDGGWSFQPNFDAETTPYIAFELGGGHRQVVYICTQKVYNVSSSGEWCNYITNRASNIEKHRQAAKHKQSRNTSGLEQMMKKLNLNKGTEVILLFDSIYC